MLRDMSVDTHPLAASLLGAEDQRADHPEAPAAKRTRLDASDLEDAPAPLHTGDSDVRPIPEVHASPDVEEVRLMPLSGGCATSFHLIKRFFEERVRREPHHGWHHALRVAAWARQIAEERFDENVLVVALLHDVLDHKFDDVTEEDFNDLLSNLLAQDPDRAGRRSAICKAIDTISFSKEKKLGHRWYEAHLGHDPQWIFVRNVVSDADKLEAIGRTGASRAYACGEMFAMRDGTSTDPVTIMKHVVEHCHEKLFILGERYFRTEAGTALASKETEELKSCLIEHGVDPRDLALHAPGTATIAECGA